MNQLQALAARVAALEERFRAMEARQGVQDGNAAPASQTPACRHSWRIVDQFANGGSNQRCILCPERRYVPPGSDLSR